MAIDVGKLAKDMFAAGFAVLKEKAPGIKAFAEGEFKKIAVTIATIEVEHAAGGINDEQARLLLDMQKSATRAVLLASAGLELLAVEKALNAALNVAKSTVNTALGFALL